MSKSGSFLIGLIFGTAVGAVGSWFYCKTKFEQLLDEEIKDFKANWEPVNNDEDSENTGSQDTVLTHQEARRTNLTDTVDKETDELEKSLKKAAENRETKAKMAVEYNKIASSYRQDEEKSDEIDSLIAKTEPKKHEVRSDRPYIISSLEFDEGEYEKISLNYYLDGAIADDLDELVDDYDVFEGLDIGEHFGENPDEPDIVFVRNDILKLDYEIVKNNMRYAEILGENL